MLTLYHWPGTCSMASHIVLEEIGAPFDVRRVDLTKDEHRSSEYLALNPHGRVPMLTDGDFVLTENPAILSYLGHRYPEAGLLDLDNVERLGRTHELLAFFSSGVHAAFAQVWRAARFADSEAARAEIVASGRAAVARHFDELESLTKDGWVAGGDYSIADPYPLVFYRWGRRLDIDMSAYPNWSRHKDAMLARPAVQRALARDEIVID